VGTTAGGGRGGALGGGVGLTDEIRRGGATHGEGGVHVPQLSRGRGGGRTGGILELQIHTVNRKQFLKACMLIMENLVGNC